MRLGFRHCAGQQRLTYDSGHRGNVFQARAFPATGLAVVVTCAADGQVSTEWRSPCYCLHGPCQSWHTTWQHLQCCSCGVLGWAERHLQGSPQNVPASLSVLARLLTRPANCTWDMLFVSAHVRSNQMWPAM